MQDEALALAIVEAVVAACAPRNVPVTLKMRSGWCAAERNAVRIARAAAGAGVAMLTVHGRTREQGYGGAAEYETVAAVKAAVAVPVVANGDIDSPERARAVLAATRADAIMIGRAARAGPGSSARSRTFSPAARRWRRPPPPTSSPGCSSTWTTTSRSTASPWACAARASTSAGPCSACPAARLSAPP